MFFVSENPMSMLGPLWAGAVYDRVMPGAPYWMGAAVFVLAALMLTRPRAHRRQERCARHSEER